MNQDDINKIQRYTAKLKVSGIVVTVNTDNVDDIPEITGFDRKDEPVAVGNEPVELNIKTFNNGKVRISHNLMSSILNDSCTINFNDLDYSVQNTIFFKDFYKLKRVSLNNRSISEMENKILELTEIGNNEILKVQKFFDGFYLLNELLSLKAKEYVRTNGVEIENVQEVLCYDINQALMIHELGLFENVLPASIEDLIFRDFDRYMTNKGINNMKECLEHLRKAVRSENNEDLFTGKVVSTCERDKIALGNTSYMELKSSNAHEMKKASEIYRKKLNHMFIHVFINAGGKC